jgi:hypothetical protein
MVITFLVLLESSLAQIEPRNPLASLVHSRWPAIKPRAARRSQYSEEFKGLCG